MTAWRNSARLGLRVGCVGVCLTGGFTPVAIAQTAPSSGATQAQSTQRSQSAAAKRASREKKPEADSAVPRLDAAAAQKEVETGIDALNGGRIDAAVASLSAALAAGNLPPPQTARALYYRGIAYRRQSKPAPAIADLTSALWLKGGLTEQQRADAIQNRSAAYRDAGLPDQSGSTPSSSRETISATGKQVAPASGSASVATPGSTASSGNFFTNLFGTSSTPSQPAQAAPQAAAQPAPPRTALPTASLFGSQQPPPFVEQHPPQGRAAQPTPPSTSLVGFQDLPTAPLPPANPSTQAAIATGSTALPTGYPELPGGFGPPARSAATPQQSASAAAGVTRSWSTGTEVKPAAGALKVAAAAPRTPQDAQPAPSNVGAPPATAAATTKASKKVAAARPGSAAAVVDGPGTFRIQVAAVRSSAEAQAVASRLQTQFGRDLGGRAPVIDQTAVANIGTLYRVQVGPFGSAGEPQALCGKLIGEGMDCRIIAQ